MLLRGSYDGSGRAVPPVIAMQFARQATQNRKKRPSEPRVQSAASAHELNIFVYVYV